MKTQTKNEIKRKRKSEPLCIINDTNDLHRIWNNHGMVLAEEEAEELLGKVASNTMTERQILNHVGNEWGRLMNEAEEEYKANHPTEIQIDGSDRE